MNDSMAKNIARQTELANQAEKRRKREEFDRPFREAQAQWDVQAAQQAAQQRAYNEQIAAEQRAAWMQEQADARAARMQAESDEQNAVSAWRFGPDGHAFRDWKIGAAAFAERFAAREHDIAAAFRDDVAEHVTETDRAQFASKQYSPKTSREKKSHVFNALALSLIAADALFVVVWWVISWFPPHFKTMLPVIIVAASLGVASFILSVIFNDTAWQQSNTDAHAAGIERRTALFGFDPIGEPDRVPVWHEGVRPPHDYYLGLEDGPSRSLPMKNDLPDIKYWQPEPAELHEGHGMPRVANLLEEWKGTSLVG
ncbi:hypothetical protein [Curtobacterium sp. PhB78]|uniref:hypothetical protein n=1 Tax=Curtobacterium sp. PhB78 TaxID=2485102 RepID=UPI000F4AD97B|nr:hypothetical protein [Curtobacterium sp. PhB78]ROS46171.1 hypothetical protein EDF53_0989 [Curtobacterium sp. PhB78]